ncbi:conserved Plasmodium protein, unknown function [Plasmodium vinckei brucechwatti]|uniref:Uncharacterized protein n=1 Tax=Plasmodium vinckei brucechwatti TaxID=119398 RepID=A0A6V7S5S2_PLAVN|nr:conserved Plasmodium protein, unknown function [Plasmodium vinckei brucechwatti]
MLLKKNKDTNLKEKTKNIHNISDNKMEKYQKLLEDDSDDCDIKYLDEKEHEIEKISRRIYEENSKIKKINLHHKIIKDELEKKQLIDQSDKKKKNSLDHYKKITVKLQNNINNIEEYTNNITNDINILKSSIDDERNERIIYNNNMKILINEYNTLKKNIKNLIIQEKEQVIQNEKLKTELAELNKEKDIMEKKHRENFKTLQQKLKEQKILSSEQKLHELIKMKQSYKDKKYNKTIDEANTSYKKKEKQGNTNNENVVNNNCLIEDYESEKKHKLNQKIILLKKLCLRILFINEYQKENINKLETNIENMNNAINSINSLSAKNGDFDHIIINLNASKEKNYSLISRINLLNYETNVLIKLNKKMKEKFKNINVQNDEIIHLKNKITNKMNDKINTIKTSLINNQETCKLKKKCFYECVSYLKLLYDFIKKYENNNNKLNLRTQIINKDKIFHFNYIHKYNEEILVDENHLNDFLIFIERYIYALNFYLPMPFNYKTFIYQNPNFHNTHFNDIDTQLNTADMKQSEFISTNNLNTPNDLIENPQATQADYKVIDSKGDIKNDDSINYNVDNINDSSVNQLSNLAVDNKQENDETKNENSANENSENGEKKNSVLEEADDNIKKEDAAIEETKENVAIEETKEDAAIEETNENVAIEETKEDAAIEETNENVAIEETKEDAAIEETNENVAIEETKEDAAIEETNEKVAIEETKENVAIEETKEDAAIEEIKENVAAEETKENVAVESIITGENNQSEQINDIIINEVKENYLLNHFNSRNIEYDKLKEELPKELLTTNANL